MKGMTPWLLIAGAAIVGVILYMNSQAAGQSTNAGKTSQLQPGPDASVISPTSNVGTPISNGGSLYPIIDPSTGLTWLYDPSNLSINPILDPMVPVGTPVNLPAWALLPTGSNASNVSTTA